MKRYGRSWMRRRRVRSNGLRPRREPKRTFGMTMPILVAIRVALTRKMRSLLEHTQGTIVSWWSRVRHALSGVLSLPGTAVKAIANGVGETLRASASSASAFAVVAVVMSFVTFVGLVPGASVMA